MKQLVTFLLLLPIFFCFPSIANAEILFQEDFNDGNADNWTVIKGENLWRVENGKYGARILTPSTEILTTGGQIPLSSYIIELDITPVTGADKNIIFRWKDYSLLTSSSMFHYSAHFNNDNGGTLHFKKSGPTQDGWPIKIPYILNHNTTYKIKIVLDEQFIKFYVNDIKVVEAIDYDYIYEGTEKIPLYISTGGSFPTEVWFDNIIVRTLDDESEGLDVPLIKQTSEPWQALTYDSANLWNPENPTIHRWGCALTSATMVLQYYGITKLPDSTSLDPGTVNTWLKAQKDGYIRNGLINWLAISRLSKLAKSSGHNPEFSYDALEYGRIQGNDHESLSQILTDNQPAILEEPGHFIVAKGTQDQTFAINDPFYDRSTLNDGYSNSFLSIRQFIPSNTDLSYMMFVVNPDVSIELLDDSGDTLGDEYIEESISDPVSSTQSGAPLKVLLVEKPPSGNYQVKISSDSSEEYAVDAYLYDVNGDVYTAQISGTISGGTEKTHPIIYNHDSSLESEIVSPVSFQSVIENINNYISNGEIKRNIGRGLIKIIESAEKSYDKGRKSVAKLKLVAAEALLRTFKNKGISKKVYSDLMADIKELRSTL